MILTLIIIYGYDKMKKLIGSMAGKALDYLSNIVGDYHKEIIMISWIIIVACMTVMAGSVILK